MSLYSEYILYKAKQRRYFGLGIPKLPFPTYSIINLELILLLICTYLPTCSTIYTEFAANCLQIISKSFTVNYDPNSFLEQ